MIEKITRLGELNNDIGAVVTFGSSTNTSKKKKVDRFSDIDIFIFTSQPGKYLERNKIEWLSCLGSPISVLPLKNPFEGNMINRILFQDYRAIDLIPVDLAKFKMVKLYLWLKSNKLNAIVDRTSPNIQTEIITFLLYLSRGHEVVYDVKGIESLIQRLISEFGEKLTQSQLTSETAFLENYHDFWQNCYKYLGTIVRKDLYYGNVTLDNVIKKRLIDMLAWEAKIPADRETYFFGKKMNQWAPPAYKSHYPLLFPTMDQEGALKSLETSMKVFSQSCRKVAHHLSITIDPTLENKVTQAFYEEAEKIIPRHFQ
jgi:aminoglycoside 6-adenylyltransferase